MGRSINTGKITIVLYEDPPDGVPKIHIRSRKYMAWIAENSLPTHMHVEKVCPSERFQVLALTLSSRVKHYNLTSGGSLTWLSSASTTSTVPALRHRHVSLSQPRPNRGLPRRRGRRRRRGSGLRGGPRRGETPSPALERRRTSRRRRRTRNQTSLARCLTP